MPSPAGGLYQDVRRYAPTIEGLAAEIGGFIAPVKRLAALIDYERICPRQGEARSKTATSVAAIIFDT